MLETGIIRKSVYRAGYSVVLDVASVYFRVAAAIRTLANNESPFVFGAIVKLRGRFDKRPRP